MRASPIAAALAALPVWLHAQNAVVPGELTSPFPTVINLSIRWLIQGDANLNAQAQVEFRAAGESAWRNGMPLRRIAADSNEGFTWPDKLAGSIFDLQPDTPYEMRLTLQDPDGGGETRTLTARTRPAPAIPPGAEIITLPAGNNGVLNPASGTADHPKVYRSDGDPAAGKAGAAVYDFVELTGKKFVWLWGITIRSSGANNRAAVKMNNSEGIVIRHCTIDALYGLVAYAPGTRNSYFGDNAITGKVGWADSTMGADGANEGEGVQVTGPGNVIAFNRVRNFRDCISFMEDMGGAVEQVSLDVYNNDIEVGADDAIEADFCFENCRVLRNRIRNSFVGLSSQPSEGGPAYFIRNAMYNVIHAMFKLKRFSQGDVALHNTAVKVGTGLGGNSALDFAYFRNNLAFGGPDGGVNWGGYGAGNPYAAEIADPGTHSSFDYDAVGVSGSPYVAKIGGKEFSTVETHGVANLVLTETFSGVSFPNPPVPERPMPDLRPLATAKVVDAGLVIPNVNDGFLGKAPDMGAYEAGAPLPQYGPRGVGTVEGDSGGTAIRHGKGFTPGKPGLEWRMTRTGLSVRVPDTGGDGVLKIYDLRGGMVAQRAVKRAGEAWFLVDFLPRGALILGWEGTATLAITGF